MPGVPEGPSSKQRHRSLWPPQWLPRYHCTSSQCSSLLAFERTFRGLQLTQAPPLPCKNKCKAYEDHWQNASLKPGGSSGVCLEPGGSPFDSHTPCTGGGNKLLRFAEKLGFFRAFKKEGCGKSQRMSQDWFHGPPLWIWSLGTAISPLTISCHAATGHEKPLAMHVTAKGTSMLISLAASLVRIR